MLSLKIHSPIKFHSVYSVVKSMHYVSLHMIHCIITLCDYDDEIFSDEFYTVRLESAL